MSLVDETNGFLQEVRDFADSIQMRDQLEKQLAYLESFGTRETRCRLHKDWAPQSFGFVLEIRQNGEWKHWLTGGLLFHRAHDRGGDGGPPTFSVSLTPSTGWQIHT